MYVLILPWIAHWYAETVDDERCEIMNADDGSKEEHGASYTPTTEQGKKQTPS